MKTHDKMEQTIKLCFMNINTRYEIGTWLSFDNGLAGEANIISLQYMLPGFLSNSTKCWEPTMIKIFYALNIK